MSKVLDVLWGGFFLIFVAVPVYCIAYAVGTAYQVVIEGFKAARKEYRL